MKKRDRAPENDEEEQKSERTPSDKDLHDYLDVALKRKFPNDEQKQKEEHEHLCPKPFVCNVWILEPVLREELNLEKTKKDPTLIAHARGLIRALGWRSHGRPSDEELMKDIETLEGHAGRLVEQEESTLEERARLYQDPDDWREIVEEAKKIEGVITNPKLVGDELEEVTTFIENSLDRAYSDLRHKLTETKMSEEELYARLPRGQDLLNKKLDEHIQRLRPGLREIIRRIRDLRELRDYLYFRRLYPERYLKNVKP